MVSGDSGGRTNESKSRNRIERQAGNVPENKVAGHPKWIQYSAKFNQSNAKAKTNGHGNDKSFKMNNRRDDQSISKNQNIKDTKKIQGETNKVEANQGCSNQGCTDKGGTHKFKWCSRQMNNKYSNEKQRRWTFKVL